MERNRITKDRRLENAGKYTPTYNGRDEVTKARHIDANNNVIKQLTLAIPLLQEEASNGFGKLGSDNQLDIYSERRTALARMLRQGEYDESDFATMVLSTDNMLSKIYQPFMSQNSLKKIYGSKADMQKNTQN